MITLTLIVILGALLLVVLMQLFTKAAAPVLAAGMAAKPASEPQDLANLQAHRRPRRRRRFRSPARATT